MIKVQRQSLPTLKSIRFGEFLIEQSAISEEQLLDVLGSHWSGAGRVGTIIAERGYLPVEEVERQAAKYHGLDVVEI